MESCGFAVTCTSAVCDLLSLDPCEDGLATEPDVAPEANVRDTSLPARVPYPSLGNREHLGDLGGGEEPIAHAASSG